jgi:hypothetical protein
VRISHYRTNVLFSPTVNYIQEGQNVGSALEIFVIITACNFLIITHENLIVMQPFIKTWRPAAWPYFIYYIVKTRPYVIPRLRMSGVRPPLFQYVSVACTGKTTSLEGTTTILQSPRNICDCTGDWWLVQIALTKPVTAHTFPCVTAYQVLTDFLLGMLDP